MNLKSTASKESLSKGPGSMLPENHGKPQAQSIGTKVPLNTAPADAKYGSGTPNGKMQVIGDAIKLNKTPQKGYDSANTPMSNRAVDQSKGY